MRGVEQWSALYKLASVRVGLQEAMLQQFDTFSSRVTELFMAAVPKGSIDTAIHDPPAPSNNLPGRATRKRLKHAGEHNPDPKIPRVRLFILLLFFICGYK